MLVHVAGDDIAGAQQVGTAVVIDHAFRIAGGARGVIERDGVPLVVGHLPDVIGIAARHESFVVDFADALAGAAVLGIVVVDHQRLGFAE